LKNFNDLGLNTEVLRGIHGLGFNDPTPIQLESIPPALQGRDLLACAKTGSGKTAAFAIPILQHLKKHSRHAVRALILTPTRELASQVHEHLTSLGRHTGLRTAAIFGGVKPGPQEKALRSGVDIVVATPGRLLDFLGRGWFSLSKVEILVLDEADRMLDMGFLPDIRRILSGLPSQKQSLLFSATMPKPIVELCRDFLHQPVSINVSRQSVPADGITQVVMPVPEHLKRELLMELLQREEIGTALVFTRTKHRANRLAEYLMKRNVAADRIHGNRSQRQRESALSGFKAHSIKVLVATDIAARGIDIEALPHVINFDIPGKADDYIHRVGRTARAEKTGVAITFASPQDGGALRDIERVVGKKIPRRTLEDFDYKARAEGRLEIPIGERIAKIRAKRAEERGRSASGKRRRHSGNSTSSENRRRNSGPARQSSRSSQQTRRHF